MIPLLRRRAWEVRVRSAGFQTGGLAAFPIGAASEQQRPAGLEARDTSLPEGVTSKVAPNCILLSRRFSIGWASEVTKRVRALHDPQNAILRYSRLSICVTTQSGGVRA
jgi:hypothetical protein